MIPYQIEYWPTDTDGPSITITLQAKDAEEAENLFKRYGIECAHYIVHEPILH